MPHNGRIFNGENEKLEEYKKPNPDKCALNIGTNHHENHDLRRRLIVRTVLLPCISATQLLTEQQYLRIQVTELKNKKTEETILY